MVKDEKKQNKQAVKCHLILLFRRKSVSTKGGKTKGSKPAKKGQQVDSIRE